MKKVKSHARHEHIWGSEGRAPRILNLGIRSWSRGVVRFMSRHLAVPQSRYGVPKRREISFLPLPDSNHDFSDVQSVDSLVTLPTTWLRLLNSRQENTLLNKRLPEQTISIRDGRSAKTVSAFYVTLRLINTFTTACQWTPLGPHVQWCW
jgi:hypothetical protein